MPPLERFQVTHERGVMQESDGAQAALRAEVAAVAAVAHKATSRFRTRVDKVRSTLCTARSACVITR